MSEIVPTNLETRDWKGLSNADLLRVVEEGLSLTVRGVLMAASALGELERRGVDTSELRIAMRNHLRKVACGSMLPEVLVRFASAPSLLQKIGNLPVPDQRLIASGEMLKLVEFVDGRQTHRMIDPLKARPRQIAQLFAPDHVRDEHEQVNYLSDRREKESIRNLPDTQTIGRFTCDRVLRKARCGRVDFSLEELRLVVEFLDS